MAGKNRPGLLNQIVRVIRENGQTRQYHSDTITRLLIENDYWVPDTKTPKRTVNMYMNQNPSKFKKVGPATFRLSTEHHRPQSEDSIAQSLQETIPPANGVFTGIVGVEKTPTIAVEQPFAGNLSASIIADELIGIITDETDETMREALVKARIGQGVFREEVLQLWNRRCAVTGSTTLEAIRASHLKAWSESTNQERLNPHNGLPLVATLDALFDRGLISFQADGTMIVSPQLTPAERQILGVSAKSLLKPPTPQTIEFLAHHRTKWQAKLS